MTRAIRYDAFFNRAHRGMEDGLPKRTPPVDSAGVDYTVKAIYEGYRLLLAAKRPGEESIKDQVAKQFGIKGWEWPRLKRVYESALANIGSAVELVRKIDAGELTITYAYETLKNEEHLRAEAQNLPNRIKVSTVHDHAIRSSAFAENVWLALRADASVDVTGISPEEAEDCVARLRATALYMKDIADHIGRSSGGKR